MKTNSRTRRFALGLALAAAVLPVYLELAVGIVDPPGGPIVALQLGVIAVGIIGAVITRLGSAGMVRVLCAVAVAQAIVAVIELIVLPGHPASPPLEIVGINAMFVALFGGAARLFHTSKPLMSS